jgi:putative Mn2+ efflux pump MntP
MLELVALVVPAGLDAFALSAGLAMAGLGRRERRRIAVVFPAFEAGMPVLGFALGAGISAALGGLTDLVAAAALIAIGVWLAAESVEEAAQARRLAFAQGPALLLLGAAVGLDELGIGVSAGLLDQPPLLVLGLIAIEAVAATSLGLALGERTRRLRPQLFERLAGVVLIALGIGLAIEYLR